MRETEEQMISECLNGERDQNCDYCPAHSSRGGSCCFGLRHEHGDPSCTICELSKNCSYLTHGRPRSDAGATPRIVYPAGHGANRTNYTKTRYTNPPRTEPPKTNPAQEKKSYDPETILTRRRADPVPLQLNPDDSLFVRFCKVTGWGAGEGACEMALNFFRRRRPE